MKTRTSNTKTPTKTATRLAAAALALAAFGAQAAGAVIASPAGRVIPLVATKAASLRAITLRLESQPGQASGVMHPVRVMPSIIDSSERMLT